MPLGPREYAVRMPGFGASVRVSTDPNYYEEHADTVELWSPGNPTFPSEPSELNAVGAAAPNLRVLLDGFEISRSAPGS